MSDVAEMWRVEGHPNLLVRKRRRRMVLTVELRHKNAALVTVTMTPGDYNPYQSATGFEGIARDGSGELTLVKLVPSTKTTCVVNDAGFFDVSRTWTPVKATADASQWWRVIRPFASWSRDAMRQKPNLIDCMPCELCWFSTRTQAFFVTVYCALAALPRDVVDAHVLTHLGSSDIIE